MFIRLLSAMTAVFLVTMFLGCSKRKIDDLYVGCYVDQSNEKVAFCMDYQGICSIDTPGGDKAWPNGNGDALSGRCSVTRGVVTMVPEGNFITFPYPEFRSDKILLSLSGDTLISSASRRFIKNCTSPRYSGTGICNGSK